MPRPPDMTQDSAETVAIQALGFIAAEPERFGRFLALTGIEVQSLRDAAREPNFLLGLLDYLATNDTLLQEFASDSEIAPEVVIMARHLLGGAQPTA